MSKNKVSRLRTRNRWKRDDTELTLLALPTTVWFVLFCFLPMAGIFLAFINFRPTGNFFKDLVTSDFVGLKNFQQLFKLGRIGVIIRNTLLYNLIFIVLGVVLPILFAVIISQLHSKIMAKLYQSVMFLPYFLSWVVVTTVMFGILAEKGFVNNILASFGMDRIRFYLEPSYWPFILLIMNLWKMTGYNMVVYLAAITGLDDTYYEAAIIDGANKKQQVRYITLPLIKSVAIVMFIMSIGRIMYSDFGLFYQLPRGSGSLRNVTQTIDVYVYSMMSKSTELASSAGFVQSVIGFFTIIVVNFIIRKVEPESAIF